MDTSTDKTKKKVAIVLSGGVSLGAYIAGALDELMVAIKSASDEYEIDVIAGASAGATTASLIAHGLRYRGGETALHDVWVDRVDITELLLPDIPQGQSPSLLNPRRLREIATDVISWDGSKEPSLAPFCASTLTLAMTITNTTGLPYVSSVQEGAAGREEKFVQYRYAEQETFYLTPAKLPTDPYWPRIIDVSLASSAIPFVFPLVNLERTVGDLMDDQQYIQKPSFDGTAKFWYCDGGTFNNLPLDLAWYHATKGLGGAQPAEGERTIVVVNPWRNDFAPPNTNPPHPTFIEFGFGLLGAMMTESSAIEFQGEVVPINNTLPMSKAQNMAAPAPAPARRQGGRGGTGSELPRELPGTDRPPVALLSDIALVMPEKDDPRLIGNHLQAMGAFLDRRFREYDFRRGAADARKVARDRLKITYSSGRPDSFYEPDSDPDLKVDVSNYEALGQIPSTLDPKRSVRQVFEDALDKRIDAVVDRFNPPGPNWFDAIFVKNFVRSKLPEVWTK